MTASTLLTDTRIRTVVLDDDPTGTQSATGVPVLFSWDPESLRTALHQHPSVYILTNTRSIDRSAAVALVRELRSNALSAAAGLGLEVQFVLRGDSTLRGHVFAECEQFMEPESVIIFVPAFPQGGRRTLDNVHYVSIGDVDVPAHATEFANDPVFPFRGATLSDYVREKSSLRPVRAGLSSVRSQELAQLLRDVAGGSVILPDVANDEDIALIGGAIRDARANGRDVVVRCGAPLAAELAGAASVGFYSPSGAPPKATLLVCGSHTDAASDQLRAVEQRWGPSLVLDTEAALENPKATGITLATLATRSLCGSPLVVVSTERNRSAKHGTLEHGQRVMEALTTCVASLIKHVDFVVSKGGITSAEVARKGIGALDAAVLGQVAPGISVWRLQDRDSRQLDYVVIPGNVGDKETIVQILEAFNVARPEVSENSRR